MRILHVVPFVSDQLDADGRLAAVLDQCAELRRRGHDVQLLGAWRPSGVSGRRREPVPHSLNGVPSHLFRSRRGDGAMLGGTGRVRTWLAHNAATFDLVHVHLTRDRHILRVIPPIRRAGVPYVVQPHAGIPPLPGSGPGPWTGCSLCPPCEGRPCCWRSTPPSAARSVSCSVQRTGRSPSGAR